MVYIASLLGIVDNSTLEELRERSRLAGFSELLLDGDLMAVSDLVYSNQTEVPKKSFGRDPWFYRALTYL